MMDLGGIILRPESMWCPSFYKLLQIDTPETHHKPYLKSNLANGITWHHLLSRPVSLDILGILTPTPCGQHTEALAYGFPSARPRKCIRPQPLLAPANAWITSKTPEQGAHHLRNGRRIHTTKAGTFFFMQFLGTCILLDPLVGHVLAWLGPHQWSNPFCCWSRPHSFVGNPLAIETCLNPHSFVGWPSASFLKKIVYS